MIELAVFGTSRIGQVHALNATVTPSVRMRYLVEPVASEGRAALAVRIDAEVVGANAVLGDPAIGAIVVASPTDTHAALIEQAVSAGEPVFFEKPISLDFTSSERVTALLLEAGLHCMPGSQRHYDSGLPWVRVRSTSGVSGRLEHIVMHTRDPAPSPRAYVEQSDGMFRDQAIHDFDMARYILGEDIRMVYAASGCLIDPDIGAAGDIVTVLITLTSAFGRFVRMVNRRRAPFGHDQRLEAFCAGKALYVDNRQARATRIDDRSGFPAAVLENYFIKRFARAYGTVVAA